MVDGRFVGTQDWNRHVQPIDQKKSLMELTADRIREAIVAGELGLGSKLSEQRLADALGVSRSPVRDALAALQAEGLVKIERSRGTFVFTPDPDEVDDLCEYRAVLETFAIRKAIQTQPDTLVQQLTTAQTQMQQALNARDPALYTQGDLQFHTSIIEASGNRAVRDAYHRTISPVKALRTHLFTIMNERLDRSMNEHSEILQACIDKDAEHAALRLKEHIFILAVAFRTALSDAT